jgi:hypothetical protein
MLEEGYDPDEATRDEGIISPAVICKQLCMSQPQFADTIHVPLATLQNWEQGHTLMDPSTRALMTIWLANRRPHCTGSSTRSSGMPTLARIGLGLAASFLER